jgi:hypothetical protein
VAALGCYWVMRDRYADAVDWVDQALNLPGAGAQPALRARALRTTARCRWPVGRGAEQPAVVAALEDIARRLGDPVMLSQALQLRVDHEINAERLDAADAVADEALHRARAARDQWEIAEASRGKAIAASSIAELRERVDTAASLLTDVGNVHELANLLTDAAYASLCLGSERDATDFAARATPIARALDSPFTRMINSGNLGMAALLTGETDTASHAFREELTLCRETVVRPQAFEGLRGLAAIAVVDGNDKRAATLVGAADAHRYDLPEDPVEARLDETSSIPPAHGSGPTHGTPPLTKAACWASRTRSPTPSSSRKRRSGRTAKLRRKRGAALAQQPFATSAPAGPLLPLRVDQHALELILENRPGRLPIGVMAWRSSPTGLPVPDGEAGKPLNWRSRCRASRPPAAQRSTDAPKSSGTASISTTFVGRPRLILAPRRTPMRRKPARS